MALQLEPPSDAVLDLELAGLDALEIEEPPRRRFAAAAWRATWPKLMAVAIALVVWQLVVASGWKPEYVLPGPAEVFAKLFANFGDMVAAGANTLRRAVVGFAAAIVIGVALGTLVSGSRVMRSAIGSLITGLQTMPSIAWFPLAILLFTLSEQAIYFVVVLGAAPSIANGLIAGVDNVAPLLTRAGRALGARPWPRFVHVTLPAATPTFVGGLKQGWAFAWRSLLAGELLVVVPGVYALGQRLQYEQEFADAAGLMAVMLVILAIGIAVDLVFFGSVERWVRRRHGLSAGRGR